MGIYAWVAAAKSIKAARASLANHGYTFSTPTATDIDTAVLVATIYSTVRLTTAKHSSAAAMVAANVAWRVAGTIGCSDNYASKLIDQCATSYRVAEQDLPAYSAAAIDSATTPSSEQPVAAATPTATHIERYILNAIPATSEARVARALYMLSTMAAKHGLSVEAYIEQHTSATTPSSEPVAATAATYDAKLPELAYTILKALAASNGSSVEALIAHLDLNYASGIDTDS